MGFFDYLKQPDINQGVAQYHNTPGAILLDVRTPQEFREGHIPGSRNVPLQDLEKITTVTTNHQVPLFVYCRSGNRSRQAESALKRMGYQKAVNIGGILSYTGKVDSF